MSTKTDWENVERVLPRAKGIAWESCHKIYVLMDDEQVQHMIDIDAGYEVYRSTDAPPEQWLGMLQEWYAASCPLRFISAITTNDADPNAGFETLIGQR